MKTAISIAFAALVLALVPYKEAVAQNPQPCASVQNSASAGQVLGAKTSGRTPVCQWVTGGGGGGGVTSITLRGTTNQITVSGTCTITSTGTCTFSIPSDFRIPGTINKITLTQPATGATITLADAKTFTVSKTLTLDGTDGMTITFPAPAGVTDQHCAKLTKTGTNIGIADAGANCNTGTVTSISTTSPITGGPITSTGTIACATCVVTSSFAAQTDAATVTWAIGSAFIANASLTFTTHGGSRTLNITNPVNGGQYTLWIKQDSTGGEGLTLGTGCTWKVINGGSGAITPSTTASAIDVLAFTYDGTNCYATFGKNYN